MAAKKPTKKRKNMHAAKPEDVLPPRPAPGAKKPQIAAPISVEANRALRARAETTGEPLAAIIDRALLAYLGGDDRGTLSYLTAIVSGVAPHIALAAHPGLPTGDARTLVDSLAVDLVELFHRRVTETQKGPIADVDAAMRALAVEDSAAELARIRDLLLERGYGNHLHDMSVADVAMLVVTCSAQQDTERVVALTEAIARLQATIDALPGAVVAALPPPASAPLGMTRGMLMGPCNSCGRTGTPGPCQWTLCAGTCIARDAVPVAPPSVPAGVEPGERFVVVEDPAAGPPGDVDQRPGRQGGRR